MKNKKCAKCKHAATLAIVSGVTGDYGGLVHVCKDCYNGWYQLKDKVVLDLFEKYISNTYTPPRQHSTPLAGRAKRT